MRRTLAGIIAVLTLIGGTVATAAEPLVLKGHRKSVYAVAAMPDGRSLVTAGFDRTIRLWDLATGQSTHQFPGHDDLIVSLAVSSDGRWIASGAMDSHALLWDVPQETPLATYQDDSQDLALLIDGPGDEHFTTISAKRQIRIRTREGGHIVRTLQGPNGVLRQATYNSEGTVLVLGMEDGTLHVLEPDSGRTRRIIGAHSKAVTAIAWLPLTMSDLATASSDGTIKQWSAQFTPNVVLKVGDEPIFAVDATDHGTHIVTADASGDAAIWDRSELARSQTLAGHTGAVHDIRYSFDEKQIATACADGAVRLFDSESGKLLRELTRFEKRARIVHFLPEDVAIVAADASGTIRRLPLKPEEPQAETHGHKGGVVGIDYLAARNQIVTAGTDRRLVVRDSKTLDELRVVELTVEPRAIDITPDGVSVFVGCADHTIRSFALVNGAPGPVIRGHHASLSGLSFSNDGKRLISSDAQGYVRVHDAKTLRLIQWSRPAGTGAAAARLIEKTNLYISGGHDGTLTIEADQLNSDTHVMRDPSGGVVDIGINQSKQIVGLGADGEIRLWTPKNAALLDRDYKAREQRIVKLAVSNRRNDFAVAYEDGVVSMFQTVGRQSPRWSVHTGGAVRHIALSQDSDALITVGDDRNVRVYDPRQAASSSTIVQQAPNLAAAAGRQLFHGHEAPVVGALLDPEARSLVTADSSGRINEWAIADAEPFELAGGHDSQIYSLAFHPDGERILTAGGDKNIAVWFLGPEEEYVARVIASQNAAVYRIKLLKNGNQLLSAAADGSVRLLETASGKELQRFSGPLDALLTADVSPDEQWIAAAGQNLGPDRTLYIWNIEDPEPAQRIPLAMNDICHVEFSADGKSLLVVDRTGSLKLLDFPSGKAFWTHNLRRTTYAAALTKRGVAVGTSNGDVVVVPVVRK